MKSVFTGTLVIRAIRIERVAIWVIRVIRLIRDSRDIKINRESGILR